MDMERDKRLAEKKKRDEERKREEERKKKEEDKRRKQEEQEKALDEAIKDASEATTVSPIELFCSTRSNSGDEDSIDQLLQLGGAVIEIDSEEVDAGKRSEVDATQRSPPKKSARFLDVVADSGKAKGGRKAKKSASKEKPKADNASKPKSALRTPPPPPPPPQCGD